jgi:cytochrome P450
MTLQQTIALDPGQAFERTRSAAIDAKLPFVRYDDVRHVPGKKGLPVLGTLPEAAWDPLAFAQRMYAAYGPVHRFYACGNWNVQLIGPEANELVLFDRDRIFAAHGGWKPVFDPLFPGALLLKDGEEHRQSRRILGEAFRQGQLNSYYPVMAQEMTRTVNSWCWVALNSATLCVAAVQKPLF